MKISPKDHFRIGYPKSQRQIYLQRLRRLHGRRLAGSNLGMVEDGRGRPSCGGLLLILLLFAGLAFLLYWIFFS